MGHTAVAMGNGGMLIMFNYEKRLEFPINIKQTNAQMATAIITQFGGPNGETGAAMRYLSQRFAMPYREVMGILTDVGTEASKMTDISTVPKILSGSLILPLFGKHF